MLKLHQFPLSHYCEKARWALEIKELPYQKVNLIPGAHFQKAKSMGETSNLPILEHKNVFVQDSADIITYLDDNFLRRRLTPRDQVEKEKAAAWEAFADQKIGPAVRILMYNTLLDHPDLLISLMTDDKSWYGRLTLKSAYFKLAESIREMWKVTPESVIQAENSIFKALTHLDKQLGGREFLVGNTFTRADLSVAALLSPLISRVAYGAEWPEPLSSQSAYLASHVSWAEHIYSNFR